MQESAHVRRHLAQSFSAGDLPLSLQGIVALEFTEYGAGLGVDQGRERAQASPPEPLKFRLEATVGIEPTIRVLQTPALTTWPRRLASAGAEEGI